MTGDTNSRFTAGFNLDGAVIRIETDIGCNITVKKGGKVLRKFRQNEAHLNNTNPNIIIFLYSVKEKDFGDYDIEASGSNPEFDSNAKTITINESKQYSINVIPRYYLFKGGVGEVVPLSHAQEANATLTINTDNIVINNTSSSSYQTICYNTNPIDLSRYSILIAVGTITSSHTETSTYNGVVFAANALPGVSDNHTTSKYVARKNVTVSNTEQINSLDISSVTVTEGYVGVKGGMIGTINEIYLVQ